MRTPSTQELVRPRAHQQVFHKEHSEATFFLNTAPLELPAFINVISIQRKTGVHQGLLPAPLEYRKMPEKKGTSKLKEKRIRFLYLGTTIMIAYGAYGSF